MEQTAKYSETQRFTQPWVNVIVFGCLSLGIVLSVVLLFTTPNVFLGLIPFIVCSAIFALMRSIKMVLDINEEKICYQFFPIQRKKHFIAKQQINKLTIVKYDPVGDYGGWGIRFSRKGKAYTVRGNDGLMLLLQNGSKVLLGTQQPQQLFSFLKANHYLVDTE